MGRRATDKRRRRSRKRSYRRSLSASNWGPVLALGGAILGVAAVVCLIVFVALPKLLPLLGVDYRGPGAPTPAPEAAPMPTSTPHPMEAFDAASAGQEVVFDGYTDYRWFGDPYFHDGTMLLSAGKLVDGNAVMNTLLRYYPGARSADLFALKPQNAHFMFAKCSDQWLTYLDAHLDGGGAIMAVDLTKTPLTPVKIKDVYTGQPEVMLEDDYIAWIERTGTRMDKLFVCDLRTRETTTLAMFSASVYGQSLPCLKNGTIFWADTDSGSGENSIIHSIALDESTSHTYAPGTYVHDPQSDGRHSVWLDAHHGEDTDLYYALDNGAPVLLDSGVVQAGMGEGFVGYCKNEAIYVYVFETGKTYRVTPERESAMFLGVSENTVSWMDVTSRERDIVKFAEIPA